MAHRYPFSPFPDGWFFVCYSHELPRGKVFSKTFMGKEIVAFRGADGGACVADAFCPHLGAHLGKRGACVEGDAIKCPFHGFRFANDGQCVSTPYGPPPKAARLSRWPVHESNGFLFAYYDAEGREPTWHPPVQDDAGYSELATQHFRLRGHPQETTENGVDAGHLMTVHGYRELDTLEATRVDGPYLTGSYRMRRHAGPLEALGVRLDVEFRVHVWGLGYSLVETGVPHYGLWGRQFIFATPSDGDMIDLHIALRVKRLEHPERILPGLDKVPEAWLTRLVRALFMKGFENDIYQDFDIWTHKGYAQRPMLAKNDGPIGLYRRYCRQFYPELRVREDAAAE
jgi:nitrite reductase/ring-hydroxylating ferredoxin subunit